MPGLIYITKNTHQVRDWHAAQLGDPAYDLAIVTRGARKPFKLANGLEKLLSAYEKFSGVALSVNEIYFYELCLTASWYFYAIEQNPLSGTVKEELNRMASILKRVLK